MMLITLVKVVLTAVKKRISYKKSQFWILEVSICNGQ